MKTRRHVIRTEGGLWVVNLTREEEARFLPIQGGSTRFTTAVMDQMLDLLNALAPFVSAHSAFPGATGANEVVGVGYARQASAWSGAAGGSKSNTPATPIPIPAGQTVAFLGLFSLVAAGTWRGWAARAGGTPTPFELDDVTEPDIFRCNNHGYVEDQQLFMEATTGASGSLPAGFVEGTIYYVDLTGLADPTDTFKLAAAPAGAPIAATSDGGGIVQSLVTQTYSGPGLGNETVTAATWSLLR